MYDFIVVGARCAGSPTAMLLAKKGYKVLLVDKARFPSDTLSTHIVFLQGVERLNRWGLLDKVVKSNCPYITRMSLGLGDFTLSGHPHLPQNITGFIAPRRFILDKILADAAADAGVDFRDDCMVEDILIENGVVTGIRYRTKQGVSVTEKAKMVIGADGKNSMVAKAVGAPEYNTYPSQTCWYYTYWSGIPIDDLAFYSAPNKAIGTIPTNDGLLCMPIAWQGSLFKEYRSNIEGNYMKSIDEIDELADLVRKGKREDRFWGMADLPNFFRKPFGPGWALVGDAGYHKDPITGQGITDAFYTAEKLSEALDAGFSDIEPLDVSLSRYEEERNEHVMPMYSFTQDWASLQPPPPEMQQLFGALNNDQEACDQFFSVLAGTVSIPEFFSPENMARIATSHEL